MVKIYLYYFEVQGKRQKVQEYTMPFCRLPFALYQNKSKLIIVPYINKKLTNK